MSELSNNDPISDEAFTDEQQKHSSLTMLFTMLLMIAGFFFASILLIHQTLLARSPEGKPIFELSALAEKGKALATHPPTGEIPVTKSENARPSPLESIRNMVINQTSSGKVRWPRLKMTGFGQSADGTEKFAIINNDLVHLGEYAGKVKLVEVRAHDVVVEYKGERKNLTVELKN